ncbi:MAG TPA: alcohol dehydrogenase catalytic domain-containing protein [Mycobacteriales bacterium]|jgi:(R,R)-butanediol dehydrogenase/meso-butanediol dehydrogenase/diacetyl reductase|nr:alcohol dehydrogenase catalytic domain-containing protein [Mycobacteriales bacterium]
MMRAAVIEGVGRLSVRDFEAGNPGPGEALVRIEYCGICGTDLHGVLEGWMPPGTVGGHEWSGTVAAVGPDVTGWVAGDKVVGGPPWCGSCEWCRAGRPALCRSDPIRNGALDHAAGAGTMGAFAEFHLAPADTLRPVPDGLDLRTAALSEPLAVALHGITAANLPEELAGLRLLVSGGGPLGQLVTAALRAAGADDVTVSEPSDVRRAQSVAAGATAVVTPQDLPAQPALPTEAHQDGFHVVFETSGAEIAVQTGLGLLRPTGTLVLLGTGAMQVRLDAIRILLNELVVTGAYCYDAGGIDAALALLASGKLPIDALLCPDDVGLDDLLDTMHRLHAGEIPTKALVRP